MAELLPHHRRAALVLNAATLNHRTAELTTDVLHDMALDQARTIVADNVSRWEQRGHRCLGWSGNLINPSRREAYGLNEPIVGAIMDTTMVEDGQRVDLARFNTPLIGAGLAIRLNMDLPASGCKTTDIRRCASALLSGLVIYDSRIINNKSGIALQADNGGIGLVVIGQRGKAFTKVDAKSVVATLSHNGKERGTGSGMSLMGDPVETGAWIANQIGAIGRPAREGDVLFLGSCTPVEPLTEGTWTAAIPMLGEVSLTATR